MMQSGESYFSLQTTKSNLKTYWFNHEDDQKKMQRRIRKERWIWIEYNSISKMIKTELKSEGKYWC